jgi:hypothetical protein
MFRYAPCLGLLILTLGQWFSVPSVPENHLGSLLNTDYWTSSHNYPIRTWGWGNPRNLPFFTRMPSRFDAEDPRPLPPSSLTPVKRPQRTHLRQGSGWHKTWPALRLPNPSAGAPRTATSSPARGKPHGGGKGRLPPPGPPRSLAGFGRGARAETLLQTPVP